MSESTKYTIYKYYYPKSILQKCENFVELSGAVAGAFEAGYLDICGKDRVALPIIIKQFVPVEILDKVFCLKNIGGSFEKFAGTKTCHR